MSAPVTIRGDLLSCYTTSIAGYLATAGLDPIAAIAPQWHVAVRGAEREPPDAQRLELCHYHTSLLGDGKPYRLELRPRRAVTAEEAHAQIAHEVDRSGAVIVMSGTERLPWLVTYGKSSAPHWLLIDAVREDGALHTVDRFEWIDDAGEQRAHESWVTADALDALSYRPQLERDQRYRMRERWAFGEEMPPPAAPSGDTPSWRWFERTAYARHEGTSAVLVERLLSRSLSQGAQGSDVELRGGEAIACIADLLERTLEAPQAYGLANDLWVIGRTRELFFSWLADRGGQSPSWDESCRRAASEIVSKWSAVARLMRYNAIIVARGRPPRRTVVRLLRELAVNEDDLRRRVAAWPSARQCARSLTADRPRTVPIAPR